MKREAKVPVVRFGDAPGGNYLAGLAKVAEAHMRQGQILVSHVQHDLWCRFFDGSPCNCNPEITVTPIPTRAAS